MIDMNDVYVVGGLRSYIGIKNGIYKNIPAEILGAELLKKLINKYSLTNIDLIIGGNSVGGGGNITRLMMLEAGIENSIPAITVDAQCISSLECIGIATAKIKSGYADLIIAGGFESSSTQPFRIRNKNHPDYKDNSPYTCAKFTPMLHSEDAMLLGAEKTIIEFNIKKDELDNCVLTSHKRAENAKDTKVLQDIIVPILGSFQDEGLRRKITQKLLQKLPVILEKGKYLNVANTCTMNDGSAFIILCSEKYLKKYGLKSNYKIKDLCTMGGEPTISPVMAINVIEKILEVNSLSIDVIDAVECNEAFAVIDALFNKRYANNTEKYNVFGGALAYGHPYGASGTINFLHLMKALEINNGKLGVCSIASAGGMGSAILLERLK